ncbi:MAG TPA: hypothetical protein VGR31_17270 [Planctomycetota bacterium]|jgi:tetratricopeptide (TPR) repeat protein|nr:hypothetical protein [Planctomycetota bacterium]
MTAEGSVCARASRGRLDLLCLVALASAFALGGVACRALQPVRVDPVAAEATELFGEAEAIDALSAKGDHALEARARARDLAQQALRAAPDWIAPQRLLDDLLRAELRGVEALEVHRDRIATLGETATELYLAGRLEGADGEPRFVRAAELDPASSWARHGLAVSAERRGDLRSAMLHARAACSRARDPWERSFFVSSLARFLAHAGRREEAIELLTDRTKAKDTSAQDKRFLAVEAAGIALDDRDSAESLAAWRHGVDLVRDPELPDPEVETLVAKLRAVSGRDEGGLLALSGALAAKRSPARDRLRAELMLASAPTPLALGLLQRSLADEGRLEPTGPLVRAARFAAGEFGSAVELWLADLPSRVLGPDGLPRDEALARVVRSARALHGAAPDVAAAESWFDFGEALLAAGWYREARALAGALARADFDRALALESRSVIGMQLLDSIDELIRGAGSPAARRFAAARDAVDSAEPVASRRRPPEHGPRDLTDLLSAMGPVFARSPLAANAVARDPILVARELSASPRLDYGMAGEVVHPGPTFSVADERAGLGKAGDPVPGLAHEMEAIHRFALLGELSGAGGPDGTVLARVLLEERRGEHLGVPWSGAVAWCEGADVRSRAEREGARISAAALHEGYWLDIDSVRGERTLFAALRAQFSGPDGAQRVGEALAVTGFALETLGDEDRAQRERTRTGSVLGEASRVRLAILLDRPRSGSGALGDVTLDELAAVTGVHEEGHLTDRTRYLPISKHWGAALAFLVECGFSPTRVAERLEYRAELVALADSPDPRVPLAQILDAAEAGGRGPTAHAAGYETLLEDFLVVLDEELARKPARFPAIDASRTLVHQLHRLPPDDVRALARKLAEKRELVR